MHFAIEYLHDHIQINRFESFCALLKRGYRSTFRRLNINMCNRCVIELASLKNLSEKDVMEHFKVVARNVKGKRAKYLRLMA